MVELNCNMKKTLSIEDSRDGSMEEGQLQILVLMHRYTAFSPCLELMMCILYLHITSSSKLIL